MKYSDNWVNFLEDILHPEVNERADPSVFVETIKNPLGGKLLES